MIMGLESIFVLMCRVLNADVSPVPKAATSSAKRSASKMPAVIGGTSVLTNKTHQPKNAF